MPLLEGDKHLFSSQDVYDLMSCLQELIDESDESETISLEEKLINVRRALAHNLAEILIREGTKGNESGNSHQLGAY